MLQPRRGADFRQEPFAAECGAEVGMQHLDRDIALVFQVVREVHRSHAAGAEFALDAIAVGEGGREAQEVGALAHCAVPDFAAAATVGATSLHHFSTTLTSERLGGVTNRKRPSAETSNDRAL